MSHAAERAALDRVDRVLAAWGGGEVLIVGEDVMATVRAWRHRGVPARVGALRGASDEGRADLVWLERLPPDPGDNELEAVLTGVGARSARALVAVVAGPRHGWEQALLRHGWRKHPLYQQVTDYAALECEAGALLLLEPVPAAECGTRLEDLMPGRDLHMDMLREAGRRADAHVARYMWARRFVRPGDRVLDAACGLGYGSCVLADGTLAHSVLGLDVDAEAIRYATAHYGAARRQIAFAACDLATLGARPAASFDVIVSFETVEHLRDPERFLDDCRRLLTPGGRFVCSVPNEWLDEHGIDPNPHHLHVFDRARLEALCRRHFMLEHVFGQTAGGGMKLGGAPRALWDAAARADDAEWWLAVGMTPPVGAVGDPVAARWQPDAPSGAPATIPMVVDFARHYEHPWMVRALVSMGLRTESPELRDQLASLALESSPEASPDRGAALCVRAYAQLSSPAGVAPDHLDAIDRYCEGPATNPHVARWRISLRYVQGLAALAAGDRERAVRALAACASADPLVFSPLLATKSVGACWLLGWLAAQVRDLAGAARWWRAGVDHAERALHRPWSELVGDRDRPLLFGLREAAQVVDLASQCASGLHLLPHAADRPGVFWSQISESMAGRAERMERLQAEASESWRRCRAAEAEVGRLREALAVPWVLRVPASLREGLRVAIFGTGQGGRNVLTRFRAGGVDVECFADNDRSRWDQRIDDVPVVDPATLPARGVSFIAVASAPGREAIVRQLTALGYRAEHDFVAVI
ncbi:MAG: methyltransferase domain-containing protein [Vicinamibacterales bacterium]